MGAGCRVLCLGFGVCGAGFKVEGLGLLAGSEIYGRGAGFIGGVESLWTGSRVYGRGLEYIGMRDKGRGRTRQEEMS